MSDLMNKYKMVIQRFDWDILLIRANRRRRREEREKKKKKDFLEQKSFHNNQFK